MKAQPILTVILISLLFLGLSVGLTQAQGPETDSQSAIGVQELAGTRFTYQGRLTQGGSPFNGACDLQFSLHSALSGSGNQIGTTHTQTGKSVSSGLFTTQLDFGASAFNGESRWLAISVRCPAAGSGSYTSLTPRQPLTPAPIALTLPGLRTQQNATSPNLIGGNSLNSVVNDGVVGATISGGGASYPGINAVHDDYNTVGGGAFNVAGKQGGTLSDGAYATIGGGYSNLAGGLAATVGGGDDNLAGSDYATVGGGEQNQAQNLYTTVAGGYNNDAISQYTTIGGGQNNQAAGYLATIAGGGGNMAGGQNAVIGGGASNSAGGQNATVPGGGNNSAAGDNSFAAGNRAKANHDGAFVWNNATYDLDFASTADNQFLVRAAGGVGINTNSPVANTLTVNGRVIAGNGTATPGGSEPFAARGTVSGISFEDRAGGANPRWVIYPTGGELYFYNSDAGGVAKFDSVGVLTVGALGSAGSTSLCRNSSNQIANCSSSLRYKNNVAPLTLGLEAIAQLRPVTFNWTGSGESDLGLVAEEVHQVTPLLTTRNTEGNIEGVKYDRVSAVLVKAVQEQQTEITGLRAQNTALEARVVALEQTLQANQSGGLAGTSWHLVVLMLGGLLGLVLAQRWWRRGQ